MSNPAEKFKPDWAWFREWNMTSTKFKLGRTGTEKAQAAVIEVFADAAAAMKLLGFHPESTIVGDDEDGTPALHTRNPKALVAWFSHDEGIRIAERYTGIARPIDEGQLLDSLRFDLLTEKWVGPMVAEENRFRSAALMLAMEYVKRLRA